MRNRKIIKMRKGYYCKQYPVGFPEYSMDPTMQGVTDIRVAYQDALDKGYRIEWNNPECFFAWKPFTQVISLPVFGTKEWDEAESEVDDYIERGEFEEFDTMDEFLDSLELEEK